MNQTVKNSLLLIVIALLQISTSLAQQTVHDMLRPTFDSSQVVLVVMDTIPGLPYNPTLVPPVAQASSNLNPILDDTMIVGDVPYQLGTTATGQVELVVPIETFATQYELAPQITIKYNSLGEISCMGRNWDISGLSCIEPVNKNYFTDGNKAGKNRVNGPWALDGNRLILQETTDSTAVFLTQTGNIKVIRDLIGTKGFRVFLPDGTVNRYELSSGSNTKWYLVSSTALDGKRILYTYYNDTNIKRIKRIDYGEDRSLDFTYQEADNRQTVYVDGVCQTYHNKLSKIDVKCHDRILRKYEMTYRNGDITAPLVRVDMKDSLDQAVNPLVFRYHGDAATNSSDTLCNRRMISHYVFDNSQVPEKFISLRGKLDYGSEDDAVIIFPNKKNYYIYHNHYIKNDYSESDILTLDFNLNGYSSGHDTLHCSGGFVNAFCMDVDGLHGEELVKVKQTLVDSYYDRVQFDVYQLRFNGLVKINTISREFNALVSDYHKSIWPTFFLTGDFTGDGKEEVILCRTANPLNGGESASMMMIDLNQGTTKYNATLDAFQVYVPGKNYSDTENDERIRTSDRLLATDLDGDGKLEMSILTNTGLDIYRFSYNNAGSLVMTKSHSQSVNLSQAHDYRVDVGDVNGDGNTDLVFLPDIANLSVKAYISAGNDSLIFKTIGPQSDYKTELMCLDYDQDGQTDIMRNYKSPYVNELIGQIHYGTHSTIYTLRNDTISSTYSLERLSPSIVVPMSLFGKSSNVSVVSVKSDGYYDTYRCSYPKTMDALMTGFWDSRDVFAAMEYKPLYQSEFYSPGFNSVFPFSTYAGGMFVCSSMTKTADDLVESNQQFEYQNAVIHKQGLGFCGFRSITSIDLCRNESTIRTYNPENFGVQDSVDSPHERIKYSFQSTVSNDKRIKVLLTGVNRNDMMTGVESSSTFTHDVYGNVLTEVHSAGDLTKTITNTYQNVDNGGKWIIGAEVRHTEEMSRDNESVINGRTTKYNADWLPDTVTTWIDSEQNTVLTKMIKYDDQKRPVRIKTRPYSGTILKRYMDYQNTERTPIGISDESGMAYEIEYGVFGIVRASVKPDMVLRLDDDDFPAHPIVPGGPFGGTAEPNGNGNTGGFVYPQDVEPFVTLYHYDTFGRQDTITSSDGTIKTVSYSWVDNVSSDSIYMEERTETGRPTSRVWFDALGRQVRNAVQRFDDRWANILYEYDDLGRLVNESMPSFSTSPSQWTTYTYDGFDRLIEKEYPDEHVDTYSYDGLSVTSTIDGVTSTRTVDEAGNLIEVEDNGGIIEYTLRPDGQPSEIRVGGAVATTFDYDQFGRRTEIDDPSAGSRVTFYDNNGRVSSEYDARDTYVTNVYNDKGLLTSRTFSDGLSVTYTYDKWNAPVIMTDNAGHTRMWRYNDQRQLVAEDIDGFKKTFTYQGYQLSSVGYSKNNTYICSENYTRHNGILTAVTLNTGDTVWTLRTQNSRFLPTKVGMGKLDVSYAYDLRGNVTSRQAVSTINNVTKQQFSYTYDTGTGNMIGRFDFQPGLMESFDYDGLNRLTDITLVDNNHWTSSSQEISYDGKGNTLSRTDVGQYGYSTSLPYAMSELSPPAASVPLRDQYLHYNAMQLPDTIIENCDTATISYYGDMSRAAMVVTGPSGYRYSCDYYDQQYNEFSKTVGNATSHKAVLWLGGTPYTAPAALLKDYGENTWQVVHVLRDNLGSITHVIDTTGVVLQEMAYTAWGQLRNPQNGTVYAADAQPELLLGRGYTGHEHLPWFGLVNMNARLYDPAVGRFLSPDPFVQAPDNTQNYNRYSYCLNNPLRYVDPMGLKLDYYKLRTALGELIYICQLDEVVVTGYGNHVKHFPVSRFFDRDLPWNLSGNYGNGFAGTWVGNQSDRDNGVSGSSGNSTQLRRLPSELLSPSQLNSCLQGHVFEDLYDLLGISVEGAKDLYGILDTETKSRLVYNYCKSLKYNTGIQVKNYRNIYRNVIPKRFKLTSTALSFGSYAFIINEVSTKKAVCASDVLDIVINSVGVCASYGWIISGVYFAADHIIEAATGKDIGNHLNEFIEDEFGIDDGVLISW